MPFTYWMPGTVQPKNKELLERLEGPIQSRIGPSVQVFAFEPRWMSNGAYWIGRLDYRIEGDTTVRAVMLEGTFMELVDMQLMHRGRTLPEVMKTMNEMEIMEIEQEGPGLRRDV